MLYKCIYRVIQINRYHDWLDPGMMYLMDTNSTNIRIPNLVVGTVNFLGIFWFHYCSILIQFTNNCQQFSFTLFYVYFVYLLYQIKTKYFARSWNSTTFLAHCIMTKMLRHQSGGIGKLELNLENTLLYMNMFINLSSNEKGSSNRYSQSNIFKAIHKSDAELSSFKNIIVLKKSDDKNRTEYNRYMAPLESLD